MSSGSTKTNGLTVVMQSILVLIIVAGVVGAWGINAQIATLTANFKNLERKIERIEEKLFYVDRKGVRPQYSP